MLGVGVFLALLLFASHVLLSLWTISSIDGVAVDVATEVALAGPDRDVAEVRAAAVERGRAELARLGERVEFTFEPDPTNRHVVLRVRAPGVHLLPVVTAARLGLGSIDRLVVVTREAPR